MTYQGRACADVGSAARLSILSGRQTNARMLLSRCQLALLRRPGALIKSHIVVVVADLPDILSFRVVFPLKLLCGTVSLAHGTPFVPK